MSTGSCGSGIARRNLLQIDTHRFLRSVWSAFESEHVRAVALRDENLSAMSDKDHDVLVHPDDLEQSLRIIESVAAAQGWRPLFRQRSSNHNHLGFWCENPANAEDSVSLHMDVQDALGSKGFFYAEAGPFVANGEYCDGVRVLRPGARIVALALHVLLDKGMVSAKYRNLLQCDLVQDLEKFAARALPDGSARILCDWIRSGSPDADVRQSSARIRNNLRLWHPLNLVRPVWVRLLRRLRYFGSRRGVLIAFLGPDGAGKSTTLEAVRRLSAKGPFPVETVYMGKRDTFLPTSMLIRMLYRRKLNGEERNGNGETSKRRGLALLLFNLKDLAGLMNWALEQWARYLVQVRPYLQQDGLVLTDRYAFDLGNREADSVAHKRFFRRLLPHVFVVPDHTYLLWEEPEVLYSRKPEMPIDEFSQLLERLRDIVDCVPASSQIRTNRPVEAIASQISSEISVLMESRCRT